MNAHPLKPGQHRAVRGGYIMRAYWGSHGYWAELAGSGAVSPTFPTFAAAMRWLAAR